MNDSIEALNQYISFLIPSFGRSTISSVAQALDRIVSRSIKCYCKTTSNNNKKDNKNDSIKSIIILIKVIINRLIRIID